jgi:hypothetical protein
MNTVPARGSGLVLLTLVAVAIALIGMFAAFVLRAQIGHSVWLAVLIGLGFAASFAGAIGGLLLADRRRNVMWILALAVSMTALIALLATVVSSFAPE